MKKISLRRLFQKIFHVYKEKLYEIDFEDKKSNPSKIDISFKRITNENYTNVDSLRGSNYVKEFKKMLDMGDYGVFACVNGIPVGYGWAKLENSKDYFYIINDCYLCRFFVSPQYRGLSIYPCIIIELMTLVNKKYGFNKFYIAVEDGNHSSINGILKVGFKYLQENRFIRCCKVTINKAVIKQKI